MVQLIRVKLKLWLGLQNHVVLIQLRIHRINLALAKRIVERIVDRRRRHTQPGSSRPVNDQRHRQPTQLLIRSNVFELRQLFQLRHKAVGPIIQLVLIRIFQTVLILRSAYAVVDGNVLHGLHEYLNVLHILQLRLQPSNNIRGT